MRLWHRMLATPLGDMRAATDGKALVALDFDLPALAGETACPPDAARVLDDTAAWLERYFGGANEAYRYPFEPAGTPFQREVWRALCTIPYGATVSYGDIARRIGRPRGLRQPRTQEVPPMRQFLRASLILFPFVVLACGENTPPAQPDPVAPPVTAPSVAPAAQPTPEITGCSAGPGTFNENCVKLSPAFLEEVDAAINRVVARRLQEAHLRGGGTGRHQLGLPIPA